MNGRYWGSRKSEWALQRGGRSAHPFSWLLSSPQQPLETEDPPTVSLAPQYTSQHLCRAIEIFSRSKIHGKWQFLASSVTCRAVRVKLFHSAPCKTFSITGASYCELVPQTKGLSPRGVVCE